MALKKKVINTVNRAVSYVKSLFISESQKQINEAQLEIDQTKSIWDTLRNKCSQLDSMKLSAEQKIALTCQLHAAQANYETAMYKKQTLQIQQLKQLIY